MIRFIALTILLLMTLFASSARSQVVKWCTNSLPQTSVGWIHSGGRLDYFIVKWDNRPVQNIGKPPLVNNEYQIKVPTDLTPGNHIVQIRACVNTIPNVCSPFIGMIYAYHP